MQQRSGGNATVPPPQKKKMGFLRVIAIIGFAYFALVTAAMYLDPQPSGPAPQTEIERMTAEALSKERGISMSEAEKLVIEARPSAEDRRRWRADLDRRDAESESLQGAGCQIDPAAARCQ